MRSILRFLLLAAVLVPLPAAAQGFLGPSLNQANRSQQQQQAVPQPGGVAVPSRNVPAELGSGTLPVPATPTIVNQRGAGGMPPTGALRGLTGARPEEAPAQETRGPAPAPREPRERLEFQSFVLETTGRDLPLFGAGLFEGAPSTFAPVDDIPVTPDYVIGPGDEILIRAWGQIDVDFSAVVGRDGTISIPKIGVLNVAGIRYQDLNAFLRTQFARVFRNFELTATLGHLRSIRIFVVGQAKRPGSYTVSSLSTLVTALFAAGGPSPRGSMRSIQLRRGDKVVTEFDLYDLLVSGDKSRDARLLPGDVIHIPPVGPLVAVQGSVNNPAIFELKEGGGTTLGDVIRWAGGLATTAEGRRITVERIDQRRGRSVVQLDLDAGGLSQPARNGDLVTVHAITPKFDNAVTLRGNVAQPGRYPWRPGMRITDLIPDRQALVSREYWQARTQIVGVDEQVRRVLEQQEAAGTRLTIPDLAERPLQPDQRDLTVGEGIRLRQIENEAARLLEAQQRQGGASDQRVIDPGRDRTRLLNQAIPSMKEVNWEYALVERLDPERLSASLIPFNLGKAILERDPQHDIVLAPGDVVTIFSREDIQVPQDKQPKFVRVEGEVPSPGLFQVRPGETLRQLLVRIGGVTPKAYLYGAEFTRESTRLEQEKRFKETLDRLEADAQRAAAVRAANVLSAEEAATLRAEAESQQALISRLRQLQPTGRIVLELQESSGVADLPDIVLEDGDRLYVPPRPSMVSVFGAVHTATSFVYQPGRTVADYVAQAGGATRFADEDGLYIIRPNGSVVSERQSGVLFGSLARERVAPGDTIVVPEELDRTQFARSLKDWTQIFYQFGLGAAALKVIRD